MKNERDNMKATNRFLMWIFSFQIGMIVGFGYALDKIIDRLDRIALAVESQTSGTGEPQ